MYRRAHVLLFGNALLMGVLAVIVSVVVDMPLKDPEGSFLGPSWLRLPLLLSLALGADLVPRALWQGKAKPDRMWAIMRRRLKEHWSKERITLVFTGIICFYVVYVSYRNLKSFLPSLISTKYDHELHLIDRAIFFGHEPAEVLQTIFGTDVVAWPLSLIYMWFMPMVPIGVAIWLVWSKTLSYGYWFVCANCLAWTIGTASYYALPTLGPGIAYPYAYTDLAYTPTAVLMESLVNSRQNVLIDGIEGVQSIAGFASLHCGITFLLALLVQYTLDNKVARWVAWVNFGLTVIATLYFGWHYVADDIAGIMLALASFYFGGLAAGHRFERKGAARRKPALTQPESEAAA